MAVSATTKRCSRFSARESARSWREGTSGPSAAVCRGGGGGRGGTGCVAIGPAEGGTVTSDLFRAREMWTRQARSDRLVDAGHGARGARGVGALQLAGAWPGRRTGQQSAQVDLLGPGQ
jgi:hypothetical protein